MASTGFNPPPILTDKIEKQRLKKRDFMHKIDCCLEALGGFEPSAQPVYKGRVPLTDLSRYFVKSDRVRPRVCPGDTGSFGG